MDKEIKGEMDTDVCLTSDDICDLRSAIEFLKQHPGQVVETGEAVEPLGELSGAYRYIGAGGTVARPTKTGPMMIFNNVKGHPGARVAIGVVGCRDRVGLLLGCESSRLGHKLNEALKTPLSPITIARENAQCQEVVHRAADPGFDIRKLIPAPTNTLHDAGPYITMGLIHDRSGNRRSGCDHSPPMPAGQG
ncbi:MAG: UbiD family decarboxylase [Desulfosarcinaceae bacterium]